MESPATETLAPHRLDGVSFGKIVQIRETLLRAQAKGARVLRFESGGKVQEYRCATESQARQLALVFIAPKEKA